MFVVLSDLNSICKGQSARHIDKMDKLGGQHGLYSARLTLYIVNEECSFAYDITIIGINVSTKYIGRGFMNVCFHIEDEYVASVSYLEKGDPKI